jgi:hypothetical protein
MAEQQGAPASRRLDHRGEGVEALALACPPFLRHFRLDPAAGAGEILGAPE